MQDVIILIGAGFLGGVINAVAGGGGILMYPALLAAGVSPVSANATVSLAVFPGTAAAVYGYRAQFKHVAKYFIMLIIPCMVGAFFGARLLTHIDPETFEAISPWLVLSAVILLALQARIHQLIVNEKRLIKTTRRIAIPLLYLVVFGLAIYGGFFGAGFGLMILVVLGLSNLKNSYQMSAVKNVCGIGITIVASTYFALNGLINVHGAALLAVGTSIGGYSGARLSQKLSSHLVHNLTVVIGFVIALVLLIK